MESYNKHRLTNIQEKVFHDEFIELFSSNPKVLSGIIFGWYNNTQSIPNKHLTPEEQNICLSLIQWLGSYVGQNFISNCDEKIQRLDDQGY